MKLFFHFFCLILFFTFFCGISYGEDTNLFPFENHLINKYGFIDYSGKIIIEAEFDEAEKFSNGISIIRKNNLFGFINSSGKIFTPRFYEIKNYTNDNFLVVRAKDGKYGFVDKNTLETIIAPIFQDAFPFFEGFAKVKINNKYGFIDKTGKFIISPKYDYAEKFSDDIAWVSVSNGDSMYVNKTGKVVIRVKTDYLRNYSEGLSHSLINNKYGYVDKQAKKVIDNKFQFAEKFSEGIAKVKFEGKWGFIGKKGNFVIKPIFEALKNFKENVCPAKIDNKWTYIDKKGNILSEKRFDYAENFSDGTALVKINEKYGYIDNSMNYVINPSFDYAENFYSGLAKVNQFYYIDKTGKAIFDYDKYIKNYLYSTTNLEKYNLKLNDSVCVKHWNNNEGFCGKILEVKEKAYLINIETITCKLCIGGCSNNPINIVSNINKKLLSEGVYTVIIPKDCITSYSK
ncbi:MAG: WG repeat-containing protein [Cyanobacteriota bacterium]